MVVQMPVEAECGVRNAELLGRTKQFGLDIIRLIEQLPANRITDVLGRQLLRAGTSVGANYRSACRAKSRADFIAKMGTVEEEADEAGYWLEMLVDANIVHRQQVEHLLEESNAITAMTVSSIKTARRRG